MTDQPTESPDDPSLRPFPPVGPEGAPSGAFPPPHAPDQHPTYPGTPEGAELNEATPREAAGSGPGAPASMPPPPDVPAAPPVEAYATAAEAAYGTPGVVDPTAFPRPATIVLAMRLMWAGAAVAVIQGVLSLFMRDSVRTMIEQAAANGSQKLTSAQIDSLVTVGVAVQAVEGVLLAGLWMLMAWANGKGAPWARIVATVLFSLSTLFFLIGLIGAEAVVSRVLGVVTLLIGAATVFALWRRDSSEFYAARSQRRV